MKMNKMKEVLKSKKWASRITALAMAAILGSAALLSYKSQVPELPSYIDPILEVTIEDEETPLASAPKVTTKTSKKTTTKKVTMKKASTRSYTKTLPTTKKSGSKTSNTSKATVKTDTTVLTAVKEKYTKNSKIKVVTTTTTTTVKTTTTEKVQPIAISTKHMADIRKLAPAMDARVLNAYETLGFKVMIDPSVNYAGYFDAQTAQITLKAEDDTIYHELGHFVAFLAGNADTQSSFVTIFNKEKALYQGANKSYSIQNSSEYFAESVKDYVLKNATLKASRPQTYAAITEALGKITDTQVALAKKMYGKIWAKA